MLLPKYNLNKIALLTSLFIMSFGSGSVYSKDYFNPNALTDIDGLNLADLANLDQFSTSGSQLPGDYHVKIVVNDKNLGVKDISFILNESKQLEPVFTKEMLTSWGIKTNAIAALKSLPYDSKIVNLANYVEFSTVRFVFSTQTLNITVPQAAIDQKVRDAVDPALFDQGIPAFTLNYDANGSRTSYKNGKSQDNQFLSLRSGFNLGAWRLRNYSTYQHSNNDSKWESINTYLERDIQPLNSQLSIGEVTSSSEIFNSFRFKGVQMSSDESMLPYSMRGYAPVVHGFAQGNAKVTIRQNGNVIYQTYVSPGPFTINDLYPSSYSGNLDVTVEEDNGKQQSFVVPFTSLAIMQREGGIKYTATAGRYRSSYSESRELNFVEGELIYGLPWYSTVYGGSILSKDYQSYVLGLGVSLGNFGGISFDVNHASTKFDFDSKKYTGQAYRLQYSKTLLETNSTFSFDVTRYSSSGFYDFSEANENTSLNNDSKRRSRYNINLSQSLGDYGSLYVNAYQQDYWQSSSKERNISAGYNINVNKISYGLSYGYTHSERSNSSSRQLSFRVSIPLGEWMSTRNYLSSSFTSSGHGKSYTQLGISGSALKSNLTYSVQQNYTQQNHDLGGNASLSYKGDSGVVNMGYAYSENIDRFNYGVRGGLVAHQYGVTLSQPLGDTIAVVAAPGASDVPIVNAQGVKTNAWGYAVKPYLTSYSSNNISLDMNELGKNVDILNNSATVTPTKGAVVLAKINTRVGYRVLMTLNLNGKPLPFGSVVTLMDSDNAAIVGTNGEVYFGGLPEKGVLTAKGSDYSDNSGIVNDIGQVYFGGMPEKGVLVATWGGGENQMCTVRYTLPKTSASQSIKTLTADCVQEIGGEL